MRSPVAAGCILAALMTASPGSAIAWCGEECDTQYGSDIDDCHSQYGDDPADADDLAACIQEARDDYRNCLDNCASAAISLPRWRELTVYLFAVSSDHQIKRVRSGGA